MEENLASRLLVDRTDAGAGLSVHWLKVRVLCVQLKRPAALGVIDLGAGIDAGGVVSQPRGPVGGIRGRTGRSPIAKQDSTTHDLEMPDLTQLASDGLVLYLIISGLVLIDAVFPIAPSETLLVTGGTLVAAGDASLVPLVASGALGAIAGHSLLYAVGARAGPGLLKRVMRGRFNPEQLQKAAGSLSRRPWLLVVADFIPWGRTILMFSAGALRVTLRRFLPFAAVAAIVWASFFAAIGFISGSVFGSTWHILGASFGAVLAIGLVGELLQRRTGGGTIPPSD